MTIGGALSELNNLLKADDIPVYYKPSIKAVMDTIALSSSENPNKWILCSERLPETTDYYLVTVGINEYGLMIPSVRTALYNAKTKDFTVHTGTNMCIVGDVIAWCDCLPEPYKVESEE